MPKLTYQGNDFYLDGEKFRILSGTIHYFRVPREYWYDRLLKLKACGLNTVETYTCWNLHERREGVFDFSGMLDIAEFIRTAQELGLYVILRPGPYICAEWDWGGLPSWLLTYPQMKRRCYDELFMEKLRRYYKELFRHVGPFLSNNGGNILMVQVENEYGSYGNDKRYLQAIADLYHECGVDCLLFTSDGPNDLMLSGGMLDGTLATANFGSKPDEAFTALRRLRPDQPIMCCEYWCGWFDHWYEEHHVRTDDDTAEVYNRMMELGASVNIYMFHGGTNFGFTNGANFYDVYEPTVTSYDYDALLSEAGDLTKKYYDVKAVIEKHFGPAPQIEVKNSEKAAYGQLRLTEAAPLLENLSNLSTPIYHAAPLTMEEAGQDFGYILYRSTFKGPKGKQKLEIDDVHDRAQIFIDGKLKGIIERSRQCDEIELDLGDNDEVQIDILVENMGRVNYGTKLAGELKGILGGVRLGLQYQFGWEMYPLPMEDLSRAVYQPCSGAVDGPVLLKGNLNITGTPCDTFVRLDGFTKGVVLVNGHNLGRYWCVPPTKTLYLPAPFLKTGDNEIVVFESEHTDDAVITFTDRPEL